MRFFNAKEIQNLIEVNVKLNFICETETYSLQTNILKGIAWNLSDFEFIEKLIDLFVMVRNSNFF